MAPTPRSISALLAKTTSALGGASYNNVTAPPTPIPPPESYQPPPARYPETLGGVITVQKSEGKGFGVFAAVDILPGSVLLSEAPLVTLIDTGTRADPLDIAVAALSPKSRASFLSLHHYSRNPNESLHRSIVYSNGYSINNDMNTGIFETASRINHSCVPNSAYVWKESIGRMMFWNHRKLLEGEEVTVDYGHKPNQLLRIYGFECDCGGCTERGSVVGSSTTSGDERGTASLGLETVIEDGLAVSSENTGESQRMNA